MNAKLNLLIAGLLAAFLPDLKHTNAASVSTPEYIVIDLGTLGGHESYAAGINNSGQVIGYSDKIWTLYGWYHHAFLYANGSMKDLGTIGWGESEAYGINDRGQVVGSSATSGNIWWHAFLYSDGSMQDLGTLGGNNSGAFGVNNHGQVVGYSGISWSSWDEHAVLYANGSMQDLRTLEGTLGGRNSYAYQINDHSQVVGYSTVGYFFPDDRAFLYSNGSMQDLGTLGGRESKAYGINNSGQVVGGSQRRNSSDYRAFLYSDGSMRNLGTLGGYNSFAYGVNSIGEVVGSAETQARDDHAFLYADGSMRDLNGLIPSGSGWLLEEATAINNTGQIVGNGINPRGYSRAFLLNPLPKGWKKAIADTTPEKPTYGECPKRQDGKDSLVVVTHGWQPIWKPVDVAWVDAMTNTISQYLINQGLTDWQVHAHKWVEKSRLLLFALHNAGEEGRNLGKRYAAERWNTIHFIAHSAGSALIQAACEIIKSISSSTTVHLTFLDPFVGFDEAKRTEYGKGADWADNYFARDFGTSPGIGAFTEGTLRNAYNVDITWLDQNKERIPTFSGSAENAYCEVTATSHGWPHEFYLATIMQPPEETKGFGFPLSKEGGNWDAATSEYRVRGNVPRLLGTPDEPCLPSFYQTTPAYIGPKVDFTKSQTIKSDTGTVLIYGLDFTLQTTSPAWLAVPTVITSAVNFVSFEAGFTSANGAEGLLSVYWGTNIIGSLDERVTLPGSKPYTFQLPRAVTSDVGLVGFRLDAFSATPSSITITNVTLGFTGIREPFTLSPAGFNKEGVTLLQLNGPAGFTYAVESSTNLTDWEATAILVNTNGIVRFTVPNTKTTARFYRAVVP